MHASTLTHKAIIPALIEEFLKYLILLQTCFHMKNLLVQLYGHLLHNVDFTTLNEDSVLTSSDEMERAEHNTFSTVLIYHIFLNIDLFKKQ